MGGMNLVVSAGSVPSPLWYERKRPKARERNYAMTHVAVAALYKLQLRELARRKL